MFEKITPIRGFIAAACILILVGVYVIASSFRFTDNNRWVLHTYTVIAQLEGISALEDRTISFQRGYLLTGDGRFRDEFWRQSAEIDLELKQLAALVADNPAQLDRAVALREEIAHRMQLAAQVIAIFEKQSLLAAQAQVKFNVSKQVDETVLHHIDAMRTAEMALLRARTQATDRAATWLLVSASLGISVSLLILGFIYRLLARENKDRQRAQAAVSTANAELNVSVGKLERLSADMTALSAYAGMLQSASDIAEVFDITQQAFSALLPNLAGTVYLMRASRDHAEAAAAWGQHRAGSNVLPAPGDCWALRRNQPYFVDNLHAGVKCAHVEVPPPSRPTATACVPLSAQGELMGWLYLSGPGPGPLPGADLAISACEQLSLALANLRLKDVLRHQAIRDPLTGLFNRRYLEESLSREVSRCTRRKQPLAVLMFDIDHFKAFNDQNGHPGGDMLLAAFGHLLQSKSRAEDIACRYGGEEFTLILPETSMDIAYERAAGICRATAEMEVQHQGRLLPRVTVSIGLAMLSEDCATVADLLATSDKRLYLAKTGGRNRVVAEDAAA